MTPKEEQEKKKKKKRNIKQAPNTEVLESTGKN